MHAIDTSFSWSDLTHSCTRKPLGHAFQPGSPKPWLTPRQTDSTDFVRTIRRSTLYKSHDSRMPRPLRPATHPFLPHASNPPNQRKQASEGNEHDIHRMPPHPWGHSAGHPHRHPHRRHSTVTNAPRLGTTAPERPPQRLLGTRNRTMGRVTDRPYRPASHPLAGDQTEEPLQ